MSGSTIDYGSLTSEVIQQIVEDVAGGELDPAAIFAQVFGDILKMVDPGESVAEDLSEIITLVKQVLENLEIVKDLIEVTAINEEIKSNLNQIHILFENMTVAINQAVAGDFTEAQAGTKKLSADILAHNSLQNAMLNIATTLKGDATNSSAYEALMRYAVDKLKDDPAAGTMAEIYDGAMNYQLRMSITQFQGLSMLVNALSASGQTGLMADVLSNTSEALNEQATLFEANLPSFLYYSHKALTTTVPATIRNSVSGDRVLEFVPILMGTAITDVEMETEKSSAADHQTANLKLDADTGTFTITMKISGKERLLYNSLYGGVNVEGLDGPNPSVTSSDKQAQWRIFPIGPESSTGYYIMSEADGSYLIASEMDNDRVYAVLYNKEQDEKLGAWTFHAP
jgi:hypothetical protein